jgi:hypothetical protein
MPLAFPVFVRRFFLMCLSFCALILAGCGTASPEGTVEKYYKAVAANRVDEAVSCFSLKDVKENDLTAVKGKIQMVVGNQYSTIQKAGGLDSIATHTVKQDKDTAEVEATVKFKDGTTQKETFPLTKDGSDWKILLR